MEKDNKKNWFKRKRYGWGWTPVKPTGWVVLVLYFLVIGFSTLLLKDVPRNTYQAEVGWFFAIILSATAVLYLVARKKSPAPKWRWGKTPTDNPDKDW